MYKLSLYFIFSFLDSVLESSARSELVSRYILL